MIDNTKGTRKMRNIILIDYAARIVFQILMTTYSIIIMVEAIAVIDDTDKLKG